MKHTWTYEDLIDLEYCQSLDDDGLQVDLHDRDRGIFLDFKENIRNTSQEQLIYHWLQVRRKTLFEAGSGKSPGQATGESYRALVYLLGAAGAVLGCIAGYSFLAYSGTTPVNVLNFLFIFIFSQLLFMTVIIVTVALRMAGFSTLPSPVVSLYGQIANRVGSRLSDTTAPTAHLTAEQRLAWKRLIGTWKKQQKRYRQVTYWPLFALSQYMMTGFNFGLLMVTVYRLLTSDIAFGWQSTIQFSVGFIHKTVSLLALPWSWFIPERYACPSVEEIEGSRIILKDGIYHLTTQDLVSWWPFLVLCIIVYGLLFRIILLLVGRFSQRRALNRIRFNTPALIQLVQRMKSPVITSQAKAGVNKHPDHRETDTNWDKDHPKRSGCPVLLLIPEEMADYCDRTKIISHVENRGIRAQEHKEFMAGPRSDEEVITELASRNWSSGTGVAAIMESWMPPINETLRFFKELRTALGPDVPIWLILVGQPDESSAFTAPTEVDRFTWRSKIAELSDPSLDLVES